MNKTFFHPCGIALSLVLFSLPPVCRAANESYYSKNIAGSDLSGMDLTGANFQSATLDGTDLDGAVITGAKFIVAKGLTLKQLQSTRNYRDGNLHGVHLTSLDLGGWDLSGLDLTGAALTGANLVGTNLQNSIVNGVDFTKSTEKGLTAALLAQTASYQNKDLSGINFRYCDLTGFDFNGQSLQQTSLLGAKLSGVDFTGADVRGAILQSTVNEGFTAGQLYSTASYQQKDLTGIDLSFNNLSGWDLSGQNLTNAILYTNGHTNQNLAGTNFTDAIITGASLRSMISTNVGGMTAEQLYSTASYKNRDLSGVDLGGSCQLSGMNFAGQNLTNANFELSFLEDVDLSGAIIKGANFTSVNDLGNNPGRIFVAEQLYGTKSYQDKDLAGIKLGNNQLSGWNFSGQNLENSVFSNSDLSGADFSNANLTGANLTAKSFTDINLDNATITGASFAGCVGASGPLTQDILAQTKNVRDGNLRGVNFGWNDMTGWDFTGMDLTDASFFISNVAGADFTNAIINGVDFTVNSPKDLSGALTREQLLSTASYKNKDLSGISFRNNDLTGCDFTGMNLTGINFQHATLKDAVFTDATINGSSFAYTMGHENYPQLQFTNEQLFSTASYKNKDLSHTYFTACTMKDIDLRNFNLTGTGFSVATLNNVDMRGAVIDDMRNGLYKNVIYNDGRIINFSMSTADDHLLIRSHALAARFYHEDATVTGGAVMELEAGGRLQIASGKVLGFEGATLVMDMTAGGPLAHINLETGAGLAFGNDTSLMIDFGDDEASRAYYLLYSGDIDGITGLGALVWTVTENGLDTTANWEMVEYNNGIYLHSLIIPIPEPGSCALALIGLSGLARRRRASRFYSN